MGCFIQTQTKIDDALGESSLMGHFVQTQHVSSLSRPQGHLPSQPEITPRGHINPASIKGKDLMRSPAMIFHKSVSVPVSTGVEGMKKGERHSTKEKGTQSPPIHPYHPPLFQFFRGWCNCNLSPGLLDSDTLKRIYASIPFLEALKEEPSYLKFLRELIFNKGKLEEVSVAPIKEVCSTMLQSKSPSKLQDPTSFSILCSIGDIKIERALCDLGANARLMPLSLPRM